MPTAPKVTLDTNSVINLLDRESQTATSVDTLSVLVRYALSGKLEMAMTTRVEGDLAFDKDEARKARMLGLLDLIPIVGSIMRWETSMWDAGDVWPDDPTYALVSEIQAIVFPGLTDSDARYRNKQFDIDHLVGHKLNRRDIFITEDKAIWRRRAELQAGPGIVVMKPAECLAYIDDIETRERPPSNET
jgi:hypothetical protein